MILVGLPSSPLTLPAFRLVPKRRSLAGSMIGGISKIQEMLDYCGEHGITSDSEVIPIQKINEPYERIKT